MEQEVGELFDAVEEYCGEGDEVVYLERRELPGLLPELSETAIPLPNSLQQLVLPFLPLNVPPQPLVVPQIIRELLLKTQRPREVLLREVRTDQRMVVVLPTDLVQFLEDELFSHEDGVLDFVWLCGGGGVEVEFL